MCHYTCGNDTGNYVFISQPCESPPLRHLGYGRVYLPLREVADTPFHIQGDALWGENEPVPVGYCTAS